MRIDVTGTDNVEIYRNGKVIFSQRYGYGSMPEKDEQPSSVQYIKGYRDGMSVDKAHPTTLYIMGYSLEKISELIAAHEKDNWEPKTDEALLKAQKDINEERMNAYNDPINQAPMTKREAIDKVVASNSYNTTSDCQCFVEALEALGLIEFVERETVTIDDADHTPESVLQKSIERSAMTGINASILLGALKAKGYKVVKETERKPSAEKGKYIFFPNPDEGKGNVPVLQKDAVSTLRQYGYEVSKIEKPVEPNRSPSAVIADTAGIKFAAADAIINALYQAGYKISLR